jgi:hypothetical protein
VQTIYVDKNTITIKIISFNTKGIKNNLEYCLELINNNDIVLLIETWLYDWEINNLKTLLNNVTIDHKNHNLKNIGRPSKGICWIYKTSLTKHIQIRHISNNFTVMEICQPTQTINLIGCYLSSNNDNDKYAMELSELEEIIDSNPKSIIIGDLNGDAYRNRTNHDKMINQFAIKNRYSMIDILYTQSSDYTFRLEGLEHIKSWIDHVMINDAENINVTQVNIIEDPNDIAHKNHSDHKPIELILEIDGTTTQPDTNKEKTSPNYNKRKLYNWMAMNFRIDYSETIENEARILIHELKNCNEVDEWIQKTSIMLKSTAEKVHDKINKNIIMSKQKNKHSHKTKHFWSPELTKLNKEKREAYIDSKKNPNNAILKNKFLILKKKSQKLYRHALHHKENRFITSLNKTYRTDIIKYYKMIKYKLKPKKQVDLPVDKIYDMFKDIFNKYEEDNLTDLDRQEENIEIDRVKNYEARVKETIRNQDNFEITEAKVNRIIRELENGKSPGHLGVENEMIKYANSSTLTKVIVRILDLLINEGQHSMIYNIGIIKPIIKDPNGDSTSIDNIRPITVSDWISNIFEKIVLEHLMSKFSESPAQFGFRRNYSCQHAIFMLKETITHLKQKKKQCHAIFLDYSKAFDKITRHKIFAKLINVLHPKIWLALYQYYHNSLSYIENKNEKSETFCTTIGVKQGGPLSPKLFAVYINELIDIMIQSGLTIKVFDQTTGTIFYADDSTAICDSIEKLNQINALISTYCRKHRIKINVKKTNWMTFNEKTNSNVNVAINGAAIKKEKKFKYLGYWITDNMANNEHLQKRKNNMHKKSFMLKSIGIRNRTLNSDIKAQLIKTHCRPILLYGAENTNLTSTELKQITIAENNVIRQICNIYDKSHITPVRQALRITKMCDYIVQSKLRFMIQLYNNQHTACFLNNQLANTTRNSRKKTLMGNIEDYLKLNFNEINLNSIIDICRVKLKTFKCENKKPMTKEAIAIKNLLNTNNKNSRELLDTLLRPNEIFRSEVE